MESAALVMLFSGMSVMFGWQPMPEAASNGGSPKVEYIVQIEPELAAALQAGHSIPITSDIPDDIGPIGRIRIVVGRDELPREKLVTHFKPWPTQQTRKGQTRKGQTGKGQTREGIVETQHTVPPVQPNGSSRYGNLATTAANSILPPSGGAAATTKPLGNPFGQALHQGAQQAKNLATNVKQQILPPAEQLFGQGGTNNQGVQNALNNTSNQLGQGLRQGLQQGVQQVADNLGQGARNAAENFGRSLLPPPLNPNDGHGLNDQGHAGHDHSAHGSTQSSATILPPSTPPTGLAGKGRRIDQPVQRQLPRRQQPQLGAPPANFAATSPTQTNPSSRPQLSNAPWPSTTNNPPAATQVGNPPSTRYNNQASQSPASTSQWPRDSGSRNGHDLANRQPERNSSNDGFGGPQFPPSQTQPVSQPASLQNANTNWPNNRPSTPEIRKDMMDRPTGYDTQTESNHQDYQQQTVARPPIDNPPLDTQPRDYRWNQNANNDITDSQNAPVFPLLLSWVLLTGSVVSNIYLGWSYFDVRSKYRGVVHGSPRRRDRYDD